jgi:hypothetical protein
MFADDFTPSLMVRANLLYENNCAILSGTETLFGATTFTHEKRFVCQDRLWTRASESKFEKERGVSVLGRELCKLYDEEREHLCDRQCCCGLQLHWSRKQNQQQPRPPLFAFVCGETLSFLVNRRPPDCIHDDFQRERKQQKVSFLNDRVV